MNNLKLKATIESELKKSAEIKIEIASSLINELIQGAKMVISTLRKKGKIILVGNGGSAADAQHIAADLVGKFRFDREGLPAIALTTNTSSLTAIANDYGYHDIFSRQISVLATNKDLLIAISTSGNSPNIIEAAKIARAKKIKVIALTGNRGGKLGRLSKYSDLAIIIPSSDVGYIQEAHITIGHIFCHIVEQLIIDKKLKL